MSEVTVVGMFTTLGFSLVNQLLFNGATVRGIDHTHITTLSEKEEEILLSLGRNANFQYDSFEDVKDENMEYVYFCPLELSDAENISFSKGKTRVYNQWFTQNKINRCAVFLPYPSIVESSSLWTDFHDTIQQTYKNSTFFYTPELYGKWMRKTSPLYNVIVNEESIVEQRVDSVAYVNDVVKTLLAHSQWQDGEEYVIKSSVTRKNSIPEAMKHLSLRNESTLSENRPMLKRFFQGHANLYQ